jgi:hypothetical protein
MNRFKYSVSFRIQHPNIDPSEISANLSLTPDTSWMAGDRRKSPKGKLLEGNYKTTYWSYVLKHRPDMSLADCLETFTIDLELHKDFLTAIRLTGGRSEYFIGWFSGPHSGELLNHQLLSKLSHLQIDLALDIYG